VLEEEPAQDDDDQNPREHVGDQQPVPQAAARCRSQLDVRSVLQIANNHVGLGRCSIEGAASVWVWLAFVAWLESDAHRSPCKMVPTVPTWHKIAFVFLNRLLTIMTDCMAASTCMQLN
jgi:hypothetical protein